VDRVQSGQVTPAVAAPPDACMVCGGKPATLITLRSIVAVVIMGITTTQTGVYCRDCGLAEFRKRMSSTLLAGWWGIVSFFINFGAIVVNLAARSQLMRLGPTVRQPGARFLSPGRPVFLRAGFLLDAAVIWFVFVTLLSRTR
jgi:hypothetical protein